jgi:hypothetical protein
MGLDIYFHIAKNAKNVVGNECTISEVAEYNNKRAKEIFSAFVEKTIKKLRKAKSEEEYKQLYEKLFKKDMPKYSKWDFYWEKFLKELKPIEDVVAFLNGYAEHYYAEDDAYFRKVNCIYAYFQERLEDEACFVDEYDLEDIIDRCDQILKGVNLRKEIPYEAINRGKELLPTQGGFFFGSTEYDKWYFADVKDIRKQMKKLLRKYDKSNDLMYVLMSW